LGEEKNHLAPRYAISSIPPNSCYIVKTFMYYIYKCCFIYIYIYFNTVHVKLYVVILYMSSPVAARSKAVLCGSSLAEISVSNPAGAWISVSSDCFVSLLLADHAFREFLQSVVCLSVIAKPR
jgi:hypothetical protein